MTAARNTVRTDDDLAGLDVSTLLRFGLGEGSRMRTALFGDGAVSAAVTLGRAGVYPRAVAFLAKVVRSGGAAYAAGLPEPVPGREAADTVRSWLEAGASVARTVEDDESLARWLSAVAEIMAVRGMATASHGGRG
ncbi:hypothetical protein RCO28_05840 [Streptomyces sp. LHD-70]|uniref:hypothetical protein n=1 Tax=Streptomyces sp. LHD-70 TaxID=3072140 RepID=UPI00280FC651|nr:hypothetical protein [Streptomyces sp. LHD-70]MDQ8702012.1 hypothetical protein [Streptomyces sp. LHD-70]